MSRQFPPYALPASQKANARDTQTVEGSVTVEGDVVANVDFPASQTVNGTVSVDNLDEVEVTFPDAISVTVTNPTPETDTSTLATEATLAQKGRMRLDANNTTIRTVTHGATQFVGPWTATRSINTQRCLTVLASTVSSGLGGTFVFEFSEDGVTATISETRTIGDFATVRDFDLFNAGAYYRVKFTPSRALVGSEMVFITTFLVMQFAGPFVRLADQELEQDNAAMAVEFAFLKAFDPFTRKSVNLRPTVVGHVPTPAVSTLGIGGTYLSDAIDTQGFSSVKLLVVTNVASAALGIKFEWSDTSTFVATRAIDSYSFSSGDASAGFGTFDTSVKPRYLRIRYTNGAVGQGSFYLSLLFNSYPFLPTVELKSSAAGNTGQQDVSTAASTIAVPALVGRKSMLLRNLAGSARPLYYGFTAGLTAANGDELPAGASVDLDIDESVQVYVVCTSTAGAGVRASFTELA